MTTDSSGLPIVDRTKNTMSSPPAPAPAPAPAPEPAASEGHDESKARNSNTSISKKKETKNIRNRKASPCTRQSLGVALSVTIVLSFFFIEQQRLVTLRTKTMIHHMQKLEEQQHHGVFKQSQQQHSSGLFSQSSTPLPAQISEPELKSEPKDKPDAGPKHESESGANVTGASLQNNTSNSTYIPKPGQRIVLLPGPHKTGSSSIQTNMAQWTDPSSPRLGDWRWPSPVSEKHMRHKGYSYLVLGMLKPHKRSKVETVTSLQLLDMYKKDIQRVWEEQQKSIVFGGEEFDQLLQDKNGKIHQGLLDLVPKNHPSAPPLNMTVAITYRSPRSSHLVSIWHQRGSKKTFTQFLKTLPADDKQWHCSLNPLGLAELFVRDFSWDTWVIDMAGVMEKEMDISNVVACQVLGVPCNHETMTINGIKKEPLQANKRPYAGNLNVNEEGLERFNKVLLRLDRSYCHLVEKKGEEKVTVLHQKDVFSFCQGKEEWGEEDGPIDSVEAVKLIKQIALELEEEGLEKEEKRPDGGDAAAS